MKGNHSFSYVEKNMRELAEWRYVYMLARCEWRNTPKECEMFADAVTRYVKKYYLPSVEMFARQCFQESRFNVYMNGRDEEHGAWQLKMFHAWLLPQTERYDRKQSQHDQFHCIYQSTEIAAWLMSNYYYRGMSYEVAIIRYWRGCYSWELADYFQGKWDFKNTQYYRTVFLGEREDLPKKRVLPMF
jgi:hypothetical protein